MWDSHNNLLILGVGNPLLGDDGAGIRAVEQLRERALPEGVTVMDGGTSGPDLLSLMSPYDRVWLLDAVRNDRRTPGTVIRLAIDTDTFRSEEHDWSLHGVNLAGTLRLAAALRLPLPPIELWGVVAADTAPRPALTPAVAGGVDRLVRILTESLNAIHHCVV